MRWNPSFGQIQGRNKRSPAADSILRTTVPVVGAELVLPGLALREMQGQATCLAGDTSHWGAEASSQGLGGCHRLAQPDARGPACQVVSHPLRGQPGGVGGKASRGQMVEPHAVPEIADGILDLGVATMVGLQI